MEITKLSNGLDCIVIENTASEVVSIQVWIKCGSVYEKEGEYGVSHFIEHLLFKGTRKHSVGEVAKVVESLGGDLNAFTAKEYTCFYVTLPSIHFEKGLDTLKELVFFPTFEASEIEAEREVILEEIRRYQDIPGSVASDNYFDIHFKGHPYSRPILGYEDVIKNITRDSIIGYYKRFYTCSNSILVVCGNIKRGPSIKICEKLFLELPNVKSNDVKIKDAVIKDIQSAKNSEMDVNESLFEFGYPIPGLLHEDVPALDILAIILGQGESSRLFKNLRLEKGLVTAISAYAYTPVYGGTFSVIFSLESKREEIKNRLKDIFENISHEFDLIKSGNFLEAEITKAKNILLSEKIYERETVDGYGRKIGHIVAVTGNFDFEQEYFKRLAHVSKKDIVAVFNKYFDVKGLTLSSVVPNGTGIKEQDILAILNKSLSTRSSKKIAHIKDYNVNNTDVSLCCDFKDAFKVEKPSMYKHKSGAKIITRTVTSTPLVSMKVFVKGGVLIENPKDHGICNLLSRTIMFGAGDLSFEDIANTADSTASIFQSFSGRNSVGITLECIKPFFGEMLGVLEKVILSARFDEGYFDTEKKIIQDEIKAIQDNLSRYASILFRKSVYQGHPYSLEPIGTISSISSISREDVVSLYQRLFDPRNVVISVVGDFDKKTVEDWCDRILEGLKGRSFETPKIEPIKEQKEARSTKFTKETKQAHILLGYKTCDIHSKDMYVLKVLSSVLSGQSGRLFMNLRDRQSLAYTVTPIEMFGPEPGFFAVYIATENSKIDSAIKEIKRELSELRQKEVSEVELERAKNFILGKHAIAMQSYGEQASAMALDELFDVGYGSIFNYAKDIMAVTSKDIIDVANRYFIDEKENVAIVHKA